MSMGYCLSLFAPNRSSSRVWQLNMLELVSGWAMSIFLQTLKLGFPTSRLK